MLLSFLRASLFGCQVEVYYKRRPNFFKAIGNPRRKVERKARSMP